MTFKLKLNFTLLFSLLFLGLTSCKKDCVAPEASENIIGIWTVQSNNGEVEFKSDGTLIDVDDAILSLEINGVTYDQKSYTIDGNSLTLIGRSASGAGPASVFLDIKQNECDEIKFGLSSLFTDTLTRK